MSYYKIHNDGLTLSVKVMANARKNEVKGADPSSPYFIVKIKAIREKGKANAELIEFLGELLDISVSQIEILKGHTAPLKIVKIKSSDTDDLVQKLTKF